MVNRFKILPFILRRLMSGEEGKRANVQSGPQMANTGRIGGEFHLQRDPPFLPQRQALFETFYKSYIQNLISKPHEPIQIKLPDGSIREGVSWETTAMDIARGISKRLASKAIVAKVKHIRLIAPQQAIIGADSYDDHDHDHQSEFGLYDLNRPLEGDCELEILTYDNSEAKVAFWHSSAHILGAALEKNYGALLTVGPPLDPGFFYDSYIGEQSLTQENFQEIEKAASGVVQAKFPFQRIVITKEEALALFAYNPFKVQFITNKIPDGGKTTAYRCGFFIDLCTGPHIPNTGIVKAFKLTKNSSAYWLGNAKNDSLQRLYGVSFSNKKEMDQYIKIQKELAERDHRKLGQVQQLFFWHPYSSGSTFFLPYGARIYNKLVELMRNEYRFQGFEEVVSPNIYNCDLWRVSGHYQNYQENLFFIDIQGQEWAMKPMNCPGHCLMFDHIQRSYKELPIRWADFGVLHRNELSGALSGLTRVRRFQQDDAHIFCRKDQISQEITGCLQFLSYVYDILGFKYEFVLSTKPEKALGDPLLWEDAETQLAAALDQGSYNWKLNPGDGAFYGPKIDINVYDAYQRKHQCGTIQLDFNLPIRFNLQYKAERIVQNVQFNPVVYSDFTEKPLKPGFQRPVIVHRAILGSIERMYAILTQSYGGKWPFWLSPRQMIVCALNDSFNEYAEAVARSLWIQGYYVEADTSNETLNKKIRKAQLEQFNFIGVVGAAEYEAGLVDVRDRDANSSIGKKSIQELLMLFKSFEPPPSRAKMDMQAASLMGEQIEVTQKVSLADLNEQLGSNSFVNGESISQEDWRIFYALKGVDDTKYPHIARWKNQLSSLSK